MPVPRAVCRGCRGQNNSSPTLTTHNTLQYTYTNYKHNPTVTHYTTLPSHTTQPYHHTLHNPTITHYTTLPSHTTQPYHHTLHNPTITHYTTLPSHTTQPYTNKCTNVPIVSTHYANTGLVYIPRTFTLMKNAFLILW